MDNQTELVADELKDVVVLQTGEDRVSGLAEKLDFLDIQVLRKFYATGKEFPYGTQPYCFPILYREMKTSHHLKIGMEALRKRLDGLLGLGLLTKIKHSNPIVYSPVGGKENLIKGIILKFFVIHGLNALL